MTDAGDLLTMTGIVKEFPGVRALWTGSTSTYEPVKCTASSARTAPASRP